MLYQVSQIMGQYAKFGKHIEDVLLPGEHIHFVRRWNVLKFKVLLASMIQLTVSFDDSL